MSDIESANFGVEGSGVVEWPRKGVLRVDLGCGNRKREGFVGLDVTKEGTEADIAHDLSVRPWPFEDGSVDEFHSSHYFEHVDWDKRPGFMEEVYRCLKPGGSIMVITPYAWNNRAIQDFTHKWPPICPQSYLYFDAEWRKVNKLEHWLYDMKCDLKLEGCHFILNGEIAERPVEEKNSLVQYNINAADDLQVLLRKR